MAQNIPQKLEVKPSCSKKALDTSGIEEQVDENAPEADFRSCYKDHKKYEDFQMKMFWTIFIYK